MCDTHMQKTTKFEKREQFILFYFILFYLVITVRVHVMQRIVFSRPFFPYVRMSVCLSVLYQTLAS